ncbi:MAG: bifunctional folylpolyglutamate synthase/dihydrofolate synthase [Chloroflexi bacterium]|nr:bifunctional folylpolyglutamate synthase/dihydrofolate synthase [Chloroflexota bacterium]
MTYDEAIDYLLLFADFERSGRFLDRPDVGPVRRLLSALGEPQEDRLTVHVAGTKGKGSVSAMLDSILRAAGRSCGLYTSPHLHDYTERVRVDGEAISQAGFARLTAAVRDAVVGLDLDDRAVVTFDLLTAIGFLAFRDARLDAQVIEVGLGGRVDSTNVFDSKDLAVIMPLSLEHTAVLGETIEEIAAEKAAIIRPRTGAAVLAPQPQEAAADVVRARAEGAGVPLVDVRVSYSWRVVAHDLRGQDVRIERPGGGLDVRLPLLGAHQVENAATAVAAADVLRESAKISDEAILRGLASVSWPGRLEVLRESPLVIADGAHNRDSARRLADALRDYFGAEQVTFVVGTLSDKDVRGLAEEIAPLATLVFAARSAHPRSLEPSEIAAVFEERGARAEHVDSVASALERAMAASGSDGVICLTGSLFVAAEGRAHFGKAAV